MKLTEVDGRALFIWWFLSVAVILLIMDVPLTTEKIITLLGFGALAFSLYWFHNTGNQIVKKYGRRPEKEKKMPSMFCGTCGVLLTDKEWSQSKGACNKCASGGTKNWVEGERKRLSSELVSIR